MSRRLASLVAAAWLVGQGGAPPAARADEADPAPADAGPVINPFRCPGEADAIAADLTGDQIRAEIRKRLDHPPAAGAPRSVAAHELCVVAELMRRVGDPRAADYYSRAIAANPDEPGYELWYGRYLGGVRGAEGPHIEQSERHYYRALDKLERRRGAGVTHDFDAATEDWVQKGLLNLYQTDGLPLLGWKAYRYGADGLLGPGLSLASMFSISSDTRDFFRSSEARNFTAEAAFAASSMRLNRPLTRSEKFYLIRAPLRYDVYNRARIRHNWIGAIDLVHHYFKADGGQISEYSKPNEFTDISVTELGVGFNRVFDLYPLFDLQVEAEVRRTSRTGAVEFEPDQRETFNTYEVSPALSRFFGHDKLTLGFTYVLLGVHDLTTGLVEERARGHTIRAVTLDYAMYRPVLLPRLDRGSLRLQRRYTRGWHFFGGYAEEHQVFGIREVVRRDAFAGSSLKGLGAYDVTLQGSLLTSDTYFYDPQQLDRGMLRDGSQALVQYRTTAVLSRRLIDEETVPGVPRSWAGLAPASLVLVVPVSHDLALDGPDDYENVRAGVEAWLKVIATGMRGSTFLITAGYDYQYFYALTRGMHLAHLDVRLGW